MRRIEHLHCEPKTRLTADFSQQSQGILGETNPLNMSPNGKDLDNVLYRVRQGPYYEKSVQKVDWYPMRTDNARPSDFTSSSIGSQNDHWTELALKGLIEKGKALNVKHVDLIDEEDSRDELGDSLVDVPIDDFIDLRSELMSDLCFLVFHELIHD